MKLMNNGFVKLENMLDSFGTGGGGLVSCFKHCFV